MCGRGCGSIVTAMTETTSTAPPRALYRDPADEKLAGVCAAMARYTDTDPVIWRIVAVVLAVFGGSGLVLYLLGWLLIPKMSPDGTVAESWIAQRGNSNKTLIGIALVLVILLGGFDDGDGLGVLAVLGLLIYLVHRERTGNPVAPSYVPRPYVAPSYVTPPAENTAVWTPPPPVVRQRSALGLVTLSVATLVAGVMSWIALAGNEDVTVGRIVAAALIVVGGGLVVGTWYGRARWLVAIGVLLSIALGGAALADRGDVTFRGGFGERTWVVDGASSDYRLGVGEARLDLTQLSAGQHATVTSSVSLGHLIVVVPDDVPVRVHATVRVGEINEFGKSLVDGDNGMDRTLHYGPPGDPVIEVDANVGTGQLEVRHG